MQAAGFFRMGVDVDGDDFLDVGELQLGHGFLGGRMAACFWRLEN
jgi:hypothetical protein